MSVTCLSVVLLVGASLSTVAGAVGPTCGGLPATIVGTGGPDILSGTSGSDVIVAYGGNDVILGRRGNDTICAGAGDDDVRGGLGDDVVYSGSGNDVVRGGNGADRLHGGAGGDWLLGLQGNDTIFGGYGRDTLWGGAGNDELVGGVGNDRLRGGVGTDFLDGRKGIDTCAIVDQYANCEKTTLDTVPASGSIEVDLVVHVSVDGLRSDYVTQQQTPNLHALQRDGASTLNARNDPARTNTVPNHTSQLSGRSVGGDRGHGVTFNNDPGGTVHEAAGDYVQSVFDVVSSGGGTTGMYVSKEKFEFFERSWESNVFLRAAPDSLVAALVDDLADGTLGAGKAYVFLHIRLPDSAGHEFTWGSAEYGDAVQESDALIGTLLSAIENLEHWAGSTAIVVTSDHGGPHGGTSHSAIDEPSNYTLPFIVAAPGVAAGSDLYELNPLGRVDPGTAATSLAGRQPIRSHEIGNVGLDLLGLPSIPGSTFNVAHDLHLS